jgi:hypothetical protein
MADEEFLRRLERDLLDQGKLIEAGWVGYRLAVMPPDVGKVQLDETRIAFFAGAQHLFGTIMNAMEEGEEPTDNDLRRMDNVDKELQAFLEAFKLKHGL